MASGIPPLATTAETAGVCRRRSVRIRDDGQGGGVAAGGRWAGGGLAGNSGPASAASYELDGYLTAFEATHPGVRAERVG
jgi:hypothetical protein